MYKPLPKELRLGFSDIHDIGIFAKQFIPAATNFGMTHFKVNGMKLLFVLLWEDSLNHSLISPNCEKV